MTQKPPVEPLLAGIYGGLAAFACAFGLKLIVPGNPDPAGYGLIAVTALAALLSWFVARRRMGASRASVEDDIQLAGTDNPERIELMLRILSVAPERNTPEQAAQLEAVKRLLQRRR